MDTSYSEQIAEVRIECFVPFIVENNFTEAEAISYFQTNTLECNGYKIPSNMVLKIARKSKPTRFCIYSPPISSKVVSLCLEPCDKGRDLVIENNTIKDITYPALEVDTVVQRPLPSGCYSDPTPDEILACKCIIPELTCNSQIRANATTAYKIAGDLGAIDNNCTCS